jgi:hypothetical protein
VAAIGAVLLLVSLFVDWYEGLTAFTVFEFIDLLLTGLALVTLGLLASAMGLVRMPERSGLAFGVALFAFVIVLSQVVNDPPAVVGATGREQDTGIWLALGGTALMVAGAVLSSARIAIAVEPRTPRPAAPSPEPAPSAPPPSEEPTIRSDQPPTSR